MKYLKDVVMCFGIEYYHQFQSLQAKKFAPKYLSVNESIDTLYSCSFKCSCAYCVVSRGCEAIASTEQSYTCLMDKEIDQAV